MHLQKKGLRHIIALLIQSHLAQSAKTNYGTQTNYNLNFLIFYVTKVVVANRGNSCLRRLRPFKTTSSKVQDGAWHDLLSDVTVMWQTTFSWLILVMVVNAVMLLLFWVSPELIWKIKTKTWTSVSIYNSLNVTITRHIDELPKRWITAITATTLKLRMNYLPKLKTFPHTSRPVSFKMYLV
jgi:hypothetical protein